MTIRWISIFYFYNHLSGYLVILLVKVGHLFLVVFTEQVRIPEDGPAEAAAGVAAAVLVAEEDHLVVVEQAEVGKFA